jgi:micrococcal nuclease
MRAKKNSSLRKRKMYNYVAQVLRVVDGDTIDLQVDLGFNISQKMRFRFLGVDAWETKGEERERGLKAKEDLQRLCPVGSTVMIVSHKDRTGKYGRYLLETITTEFGVDVFQELAEGGHFRWVAD